MVELKKQTLDIDSAYKVLKSVVLKTPLQFHRKLSEKFGCEVYLKREDLQIVRSYKIRGAYNLISSLNEEQRNRGVVCASAGNHAQGVAFSCKALDIKGVIYMPAITPKQKINQVKMFGGDNIEVVLIGDTFDDCQAHAIEFTEQRNCVFTLILFLFLWGAEDCRQGWEVISRPIPHKQKSLA
jgi:threonine dehydratase